jgi:glycosyltransferase involved in cell wall biosynthesis
MIGNLKKQKNPMGFIEIARRSIAVNKDMQFIFAGDGPLREHAQEEIGKYKLKDKVKLLGWIKEPEKMLKCVDLFLLTSLWEGLPCTLVQAAAAGVPAVASDIAGNSEFIKLANSGELYPPKDYKAGAEAVLRAAEKKTKQKIKTSVLKEFDVKYMVKEHEKLYLKELSLNNPVIR